MPEHERTLIHVRLNHQSVETLKHARHATGFATNQEVVDEALKLYNMVLSNEFDKSKQEIMTNAYEDVRRVERLEQWANSDKVVVKEVVRVEAPPEPVLAAEDPNINPFAKYSRDDLLAKCIDTEASMIMDWTKAWKAELDEVGWKPGDFVKAKLEWNKAHLKAKVPVSTASATPVLTEVNTTQFRIDALVRRLYNISLGDKNMARFQKDFEMIRALGINNGQMETFKATVITAFKRKVQPDIIAKRVKAENVEGTLTIFEDAWFREFETTEEEKEELMRVGT